MDLSNENILHIKKDGIEYLQFKKLLNYPEIKQAYVIGLDKNFKIYSNPNKEEELKNNDSKNNYKKICKELNLDYNHIVNTMQNHTDNIKIINGKINLKYMFKDILSLISFEILSTLVASFLPLLKSIISK